MRLIKYLAVLLIILSFVLGAGCNLLPSIDIGLPTTPSPTTSIPTSLPPVTTTPPVTTPTNPTWTPPTTESPRPLLPDFTSVVAKVKPSVVAINTEVVTRDIFGRPVTQEAAGSGWIIDEAGYVVTNNHVVEGAQSITVTLDDDRTFTANIVGTDSIADIAVIRIEAQNLVRAAVGDPSKLEIGEWVLAVGNSLNLGVTPSEGIVRSLNVSLPVSAGQTLNGLIGTSAPINPGNSGGPLVNLRGEVVGITTVKISMVGVEGMGWAISIETAKPIIESLIQKGYVVRPYLGVVLADVTQFLVLTEGLSVDKGAFITEVAKNSPADAAGLKAGDIIVSIGSTEITNAQELVQAIYASEIGKQIEIIFWRGNTKSTTFATPIE
ncbi:MAG: PDZ domain-containing protein, partial [Chloroflexi bacterium]|nr:PDZ domain-containing protein [Chloroflexota bacterium]